MSSRCALHALGDATCNTPAESATVHATPTQRGTLKALAEGVLARNDACNDRATLAQQPLQRGRSAVALDQDRARCWRVS